MKANRQRAEKLLKESKKIYRKKFLKQIPEETWNKLNLASTQLEKQINLLTVERLNLEYDRSYLADMMTMEDLSNAQLLNELLKKLIDDDEIDNIRDEFILFLKNENCSVNYFNTDFSTSLDAISDEQAILDPSVLKENPLEDFLNYED